MGSRGRRGSEPLLETNGGTKMSSPAPPHTFKFQRLMEEFQTRNLTGHKRICCVRPLHHNVSWPADHHFQLQINPGPEYFESTAPEYRMTPNDPDDLPDLAESS